MRISVVNQTHGLLSEEEVQAAIRAVNRQIGEDFAPYWNITGTLRLEGSTGASPNAEAPVDMQGEAILYLWDESDVPNALGYHEANHRGIPFGFVFIDIATELEEDWTVTFSHEALELLGDRQANLLVQGPHPEQSSRTVYHWREMCDAVQAETYVIDGISVSNFVLPLYFTPDLEEGSRNDFLGRTYENPDGSVTALASFGVNPGGYVGFYDPTSQKHETVMGLRAPGGRKDETRDPNFRRQHKNKARKARRGNRYSGLEPVEVLKATTLEAKKSQSMSSGKYQVHVVCDSQELKVSSGVLPLMAETHKKEGHYGHDHRKSAAGVNSDIELADFEEIVGSALQVEAAEVVDAPETPIAEVSIEHPSGEAVLAMVEVDGVLFFHAPHVKDGKSSSFQIPIPRSRALRSGRRGSFLGKISKTVIRFVKHRIVDSVRDAVENHLSDYLAKQVERHGFKKDVSGRLEEFSLRKKPRNKTIGQLDPIEGALPEGKSYLLFVHGIFSSTKGAFGEVLLDRRGDAMLKRLKKSYDHVIGFDHWTVAKSTLENAAELLSMLPENCHLDVVCHSRGAGVTRCLLEHPDLAAKLGQRGIKVGKVMFVAGASQGSQLADPDRIGALVNVASVVSSLSGATLPLALFTGLLKAVQYGVVDFPGIAAMAPDSAIIRATNSPLSQPGSHYITMRSDFEPEGKFAEMLDSLALDQFVFHGKANDGVVPFEGAGTFDDQVKAKVGITAGPEFRGEDGVFHTKFFRERRVRQAMLHYLVGAPGEGAVAMAGESD